jgi:predicted metalloprotease with PDZ domain
VRPKVAPPIHYHLDLRDPKSHLVAVEMQVPCPHSDPLRLALPAWTPGSYKIRDFARHVQEFAALDDRRRRLPWRKRDKQSWEVAAPPDTPVIVRYRVYANELGVRTSHLDDRHAHLNGASLFLYAEDLRDRACEVSLDPPRGWRVATALRGLQHGRFGAAHYDELVDAPVEVGIFDEAHFRERSIPHRVVLCGQGERRAVDLVPDLQRIVRAGAALFGRLPYREYVFFIHLAQKRGGGLEHANGTSLLVARDGLEPRERYLEFLLLAAHEHFHAWNGKRLWPEAFGTLDYSREVYCRMLWVVEGWTSYYEKILLRRAQLATSKEVLGFLAERIRRYRETPGRRVESLADASFDAWIHHYQPDENSPNSGISYYEKGQLVAFLLDLELRRRSRGRKSLDDALLLLYERFGERGVGYPDGAVREAAEEVARGSLETFFDRYVYGTDELDFEEPLEDLGLRIVFENEEPPRADLGLLLEDRDDRVAKVATVLAGGPAAAAGLDAHDEIIAWSGVRVDRPGLERRLQVHRPGDRVELTVFRGDLLRQFSAVLGRAGPRKIQIVKAGRPSRLARRLYQGWMGEPY